ncbi:uncharacterized protein PITG_16821 [Phytophthora infestans T30-4]|uniref:Uncharacterized protein n=1 Tax=Phytophthora infestans (strain T30-4) TaxID=403677 RepID=D0NU69_PHYIT|nr:uncharacterized protein PITG_16821 [Phytophthora infestans T30-4]EEY65202.1 conserved hypothetical protein [Phytophthora infestans T30-4]|eukprot:XP_002897266.1 conserved hypothetical protein [Phytophthora infestans T30-4]
MALMRLQRAHSTLHRWHVALPSDILYLQKSGARLHEYLSVFIWLPTMKCRTTYSSKKKMKLVRSIREGGNIEAIGEESGVPARNLFRKEKALQMAALAWTSCNFNSNISSGFQSCGIFPLNLVKMHEKLLNFQHNGVSAIVKKASWLRYKETVQHDILLLPGRQQKQSRKRKTKTVAGRLLTREMLQQPDQPSQRNEPKRTRKSQRDRISTKTTASGMHRQDQELHQKQYHDHSHENEHKHEEEQGMESELVLVQQQSEVASSDTVLFEVIF